MRLTHDHAVREVALLRHGVYARLPHLCYVPLIAAARHGGSWTSLMVDVSPALTAPGDAPIPIADLRRYLAHLAAAHARFLQDASLRDPALGLSTLADFLLILTPARAQGEIVQGHSHPVLDAALRGWTVFADVAPPAAAEVITALQRDVRPLLAALDSPPHTLLHGDYKLANLGTLPATDPEQPGTPVVRTIMLDWQDASVGPPLLDVGYFLAITAARLPVTKELALDIYRDALAAAGVSYPQQAWERTVALGLLGGGAMRLLWQPALVTQAADPVARARKQNWPGGASKVVRARRWLP
jgi:hypothetical protein